MCHGVFDLVHPGHIRHLAYAKTQADLLIVSITSDVHVHKDSLRPYVPQQLRAENLAALQIVDYVIIDTEPTPIKNIEKIKPDFFVKAMSILMEKLTIKQKLRYKHLKNMEAHLFQLLVILLCHRQKLLMNLGLIYLLLK